MKTLIVASLVCLLLGFVLLSIAPTMFTLTQDGVSGNGDHLVLSPSISNCLNSVLIVVGILALFMFIWICISMTGG